jgi:hypothetical protein
MDSKLDDRPDQDSIRPDWYRPENDALEDKYNAPSATDDDLPEGHPDRQNKKSFTPEELGESEAASLAASPETAAEQAEENQLGKGYREEKKVKRRVRLTRRRAIIGGGALGGTVATVAIFSFLQGPFEFIHIAQLLQRFHFASIEDNGNSRLLKLYKWSKSAKVGARENTNLGAVGTRIAKKIDLKLADIGLEKTYAQGVFGATYDGMKLDRTKFSENAENGSLFKNLSDEEFLTKFKEAYGIEPIHLEGDLYKIPPEEGLFGYFKNRTLNKLVVRETGTDGVTGSISARIMGKRDSVTWHPIRRLDAKITGTLDQKFAAWLAELKSRLKNGADSVDVTASGEKTTDADGNPIDNPINDEGASAIDDAGNKASEAVSNGEGGTEGILSRFTGSPTGKLTMGATAAVGLICAAKGMAEAADGLKHDMVILPLIRAGVQAMSVGNQVMSGNDLDMTQLSFFAKEFNDPETGTSWAAARSIQAELGQDQTGPDIPDEANIKNLGEGSVFTQILNKIPGIGITCNVAGSLLGRTITFGVSLLTPIATISTEILMRTPQAREALAGIIKWMAGSPIPTLVFGPTYGNYINYGTRLAANDTKAALGGKALTPSESTALREDRLIAEKQDFAQRSFAQKVFDPYSPDSVISKAMDSSSSSTIQNMASIFSVLSNPFKAFGSLALKLTPKIHAETSTYDYGFPEFGFSLDELNSSSYDNPYTNGDAVINTLNIPCEINGEPHHPCGQDYIDKAYKCFGVTMYPDGRIDSGLNNTIDVNSKDYKSYGCDDSSAVWTQIRFYILDMKTAQSADCYLTNEAGSCQQVGF